MKEIYQDSSEENLESILEDEEMTEEQAKELEIIIETQKQELIEVQQANGDDCDPETGEEYDFSEMQIDIEIVVPEDWE